MSDNENIITPHGGYRNLKSYQMSEIVYDATVKFCDMFIEKRSRTKEQMVQASRSGKQNIAEGSMASGTSKKTELKLIGVARASLEELLLDYQDYLRQHNFPLWTKNDQKVMKIRKIGTEDNRSYMSYKTYIEESNSEIAANTIVCIIHQTNYLLDQLLRKLEMDFKNQGGFSERLYRIRKKYK